MISDEAYSWPYNWDALAGAVENGLAALRASKPPANPLLRTDQPPLMVVDVVTADADVAIVGEYDREKDEFYLKAWQDPEEYEAGQINGSPMGDWPAKTPAQAANDVLNAFFFWFPPEPGEEIYAYLQEFWIWEVEARVRECLQGARPPFRVPLRRNNGVEPVGHAVVAGSPEGTIIYFHDDDDGRVGQCRFSWVARNPAEAEAVIRFHEQYLRLCRS